jgi:hypothetical protein
MYDGEEAHASSSFNCSRGSFSMADPISDTVLMR